MWFVVVLMIGIFFLFMGVADGWIFFLLRFFFLFLFLFFVLWLSVVLTVVGSEFAIDGGDGLRRI